MVRRRRAPASSSFALALTLAALPAAAEEAPAFRAALARGDEHYAGRAEGAQGAVARAGPVDEAITGYRIALSLRPDSTEARYGLVRALFFRANFCGSAPELSKRLFEEARQIGEEGVARLEPAIGDKKGAARVAALRELPGAAEMVFWAGVAWGEWALRSGRVAAARAGAPGKIRDLAQTTIDVDPRLEEAGGHRLLGRLHDLCPRVPLFTGFVSRRKALENLRKAYAAFPGNTVNQFLLADAILRHDERNREEARTLLARCAAEEPRAEYRVEDAHYAALAGALMASLRQAAFTSSDSLETMLAADVAPSSAGDATRVETSAFGDAPASSRVRDHLDLVLFAPPPTGRRIAQ
jgi:tetratricopeptide (TPR) repeat protein